MRIRLGAMFSNFTETTNIRLNAVIPEQEVKTVPLISDRIIEKKMEKALLEKGQILIPELIAKGMKVNVGDSVVLVANNKDGSVNGKTFTVSGVLEGISGPGWSGRDDSPGRCQRTSAHPDGVEVTEIAIRLKSMDHLQESFTSLKVELERSRTKTDRPYLRCTPGKTVPLLQYCQMIDLMTLFIKIMLVAIVLVSIMNVMIMAVYERINEIGTIAAIGTQPRKIMALFVAEGFLLGVLERLVGT
jgi:putative ABC transport system permease protein